MRENVSLEEGGIMRNKNYDSPELWGREGVWVEEGENQLLVEGQARDSTGEWRDSAGKVGENSSFWGYIMSQDLWHFILYILYKNIYYYLISL